MYVPVEIEYCLPPLAKGLCVHVQKYCNKPKNWEKLALLLLNVSIVVELKAEELNSCNMKVVIQEHIIDNI